MNITEIISTYNFKLIEKKREREKLIQLLKKVVKNLQHNPLSATSQNGQTHSNCLGVPDHFVGLVLKRLRFMKRMLKEQSSSCWLESETLKIS